MEIQLHVCVPSAKYLWQRISGPFAPPFALQGPIVMTLLRQCIWWTIVFLAFHLLQLVCEGRQRQARTKKLFEDLQSQSDSERKGVEQLCHLHGQASPATAELRANGGAPLETPPLVPVSMCVVDDSCGDILDDRHLLLGSASQLHAPGEEVTVLQACAGPVVQTKLTKLEPAGEPASLCNGDTINTPSTTSGEAAAVEKGKSILIQLGRWRVFRTNTGGKEARLLKVDDTDPVPVVLHSSYSGGILNVEGLHLRGATIQAITKNKCIILETKSYKQVIESFVDGQGSCQVEAFTSESGLPSKNLDEVFVLASKKIEVGGFKLSVNSSAIQVQNDSLRTVIRSIFPLTILSIYAITQILSTILVIMGTTNMVSVTTWLLLCVVVIATQALPLRIETTITKTLRKLVVHTYHTIYFAAQCFNFDKDPRVLNIHEEISTVEDQQVLKKEKSSNIQSTPHILVEDPTWKWEVYDNIFDKKIYDYKLVKREQSKEHKNQARQPFVVIHKNIKDLPWASQVEVCVYSPSLMEIINVVMPPKVDQIARGQMKVTLNGPELFQIREELRNKRTSFIDENTSAASSSGGTSSDSEGLWHLQHLLSFIDEEFNEIEPAYSAMNSGDHKVSWEMLWAFFPPGERVVYIDDTTKEKSCGDVLLTTYMKDWQSKKLSFVITVTKWDYNCKTWTQYSTGISVAKFEGERGIFNLDVYPLRFVEDPKVTLASFLRSGKTFCELSMLERCSFKNYRGSIFIYKQMGGCLQLFKENADGRVMIDLGSFAKMNPDYPTLSNAKPPCDFMRDNKEKILDITQNEDRMFAPTMVYGFSFRLKKWGSFSVCGFSPIYYNKSAFDDLVMDEDTKDVLEKIVKRQLEDKKDTNFLGRNQLDSIAGKGEGTIFLCYGPPGTGKTLTAESLSESLECPLWCLSVSELGMTLEILEENLQKIFDVADFWGALLLLDEADVFLERRSTSDLARNAMAGIFLRLLEYYKGVLFLTTNRDYAFDNAMCSRIAMKLYYKRHNEDQRKTMWTKMFERSGLLGVSAEDLVEFAMPDFNGREIRNIVNTAHLLSRSEDNQAKLEIEHVKKAWKVYKDSCQVWIGDRPTTVRRIDEEPT